MVDFNSLLNLQIQLLLLMLCGYLLCKWQIINATSRKALTDLVIDLILPCNIIHSFQIEMSFSLLKSGILVFLMSIAIQLFCTFINPLLWKTFNKSQYPVLSYATICSNAGFMGNPLVEGIYGSTGLLFASIYLIPQRIVMWSAGVSCFESNTDSKNVIKKVLTHPCIIAVFIGIIIMVFQIQLPTALNKTILSLSNCTTALSMICIGGILSEINLKSVISKLSIFYSFLRLIVIPGIVLITTYLLHLPTLVIGVCTVLSGMPAGTTTALLAEKYHCDRQLAVQIIFLSTILSILTIPLLCLIIEIIV